MLFLNSNPRKRTTLIIISVFSVLFIFFQLIPYDYDSLTIPGSLNIWGTDNSLGIEEELDKESSSSSTFASPSSSTSSSSDSEKYLTYLPYSRFSNQRGILLNAILLAKYLNRTLVVPPLFLGYANGWSPGPLLYSVLEHMTDPRLQDKCFDKSGKLVDDEPIVKYDMPTYGCFNFTAYAIVPWSDVTDIKQLSKPEEKGGLGVKIIEREDMSLTSLKDYLNITNEEDVYLMSDSTRYQWHYYEDNGDPIQVNPRYENEISLSQLAAYDQKVIHFYGIFGYDRLSLTSTESEYYRLKIQQSLLIKHPVVMDASSMILEQLLNGLDKSKDELMPLDSTQAQQEQQYSLDNDSLDIDNDNDQNSNDQNSNDQKSNDQKNNDQKNNDQKNNNENNHQDHDHNDNKKKKELPKFVAAHVRAGDADFLKGLKNRVPQFVYELWAIMHGNETIANDLVGFSNNKTAMEDLMAMKVYPDGPLPKAPESIHQQLTNLSIPDRLKKCTSLNQMILYVATDAVTPRENPDLQPIYDAFPCTFVMADFDYLNWQEPLKSLRSPLDPHKTLTKDLLMFVDATICAWAERFVGTRTSTFSNYILQYRHAIVDDIIEKENQEFQEN
ncbi:unnamed protein product [Cunninghamella blakesleeana]